MRILSIYKYYWPDAAPYARLLKSILEGWARAGHEVEVITAQPGYNDVWQSKQPSREVIGGVSIVRLPTVRENKRRRLQRLAAFVSFLTLAVGRACFGPRADLILVNANPPILMGLAVRLIRRLRGIPYVYHCQDIHPESARIAGRLHGRVLYRLLRRIDTGNCSRAGRIVTLSPDMRATLLERGIDDDKIEVINNFIVPTEAPEESAASSVRSLIGASEDDFLVVFTGNLGQFQGLELIVESAWLLRGNRDVKFLFMGEGSSKADMMAAAGELRDKSVFFLPFKPQAIAALAMKQADLCLVSLARGIYKVAYPSKTMMYLASGSPVLAVVESASCLSADLQDNGVGLCCEQGDPEELARTILDARDRRHYWRGRRSEIARFAHRVYGYDAVAPRWALVSRRTATRRRS